LTEKQSEASKYPENPSTKSLARGLQTAFQTYVKTGYQHECCILFLVQYPERNIFDQRHLEYELEMADAKMPVFRLAFADVLKHTTLANTSKRQLVYHAPHNPGKTYEVAVVYFRCGYGPSDYPDESAWKARLQIESSNAIKCPSVLSQLAGAKKVQQVLATPTNSTTSILKRFMKDSDNSVISNIQKTFTNIYPLDDTPAGLQARKLALDSELCKGYVLKPQREGGGNNTYRSAIPPFLKSLPESHWKSFILMEIITPPPVHNMILRNGVVEKGGVICELGIYGTCLWSQQSGKILLNQEAGYLLRTKGDKSEEGGVAAGFGAMDSCFLV
jgi:glutathione synthetase